jgi:hypothetical protein
VLWPQQHTQQWLLFFGLWRRVLQKSGRIPKDTDLPSDNLRSAAAPTRIVSTVRLGEVEVEVNLRPTACRPVGLGVRCPSGTCDQFFFRLAIFFGELRVCYFVAPSLTRGRVCNLLYNYFSALPKQSLSGPSPAELTALFYCLIWLSQLRGSGLHTYTPQEQGGSYTPGHWVPFLSPLTTRRATAKKKRNMTQR